MNAPAAKLFAPLEMGEGKSLLDLVTNPIMEEMVENWPEVAHYTGSRLRAESDAHGGLPELETAVDYLAPFMKVPTETIPDIAVPTVYRFGGRRLSLYGTIAQFSTVNDETLDDLKIELFFPADPESKELLQTLGN